ncbi:uncharacterized protein LOC107367970 [Tetranychus urticae]|uniref:Uncharacterized protein n=1 Tax=Tetranychus urticae TaxID=32264 RepID=T1KW25_TETUR|nr:uncharacterized protein LOC107367970 [Tetranychus urticae]
MVPTLSTLRFSGLRNGIIFAQLIVIIAFLPFSSHQRLSDDLIVIYSTGPCLILKFFSSTQNGSLIPRSKKLEVPLSIDGKPCSQNDLGWITSLDYFIEPSTGDINLIWGDSESQSLWSGRLNSSNNLISDVRQLSDSSNSKIGSHIRSLIYDEKRGELFASLPLLQRIEREDLISDILPNDGDKIVKINRNVIIDNVDIGKVLYDETLDKLYWIESKKCIWSGSPRSQEKNLLMCANQTDGLIYSFVIDKESHEIYVFYGNGKIERLSGPDGSSRNLIITNCLAGEKYNDAKFYTIEMFKHENYIRFYASDTQHYAFRQITLTKGNRSGQPGIEDEEKYFLDVQNSGILFTDQPNIYDFVFLADKFDNRSNQVPNNSTDSRSSPKVTSISSTSGETLISINMRIYALVIFIPACIFISLGLYTVLYTKSKVYTPFTYNKF